MSRIKEISDGCLAIYGFLSAADRLLDVYKHEHSRRRNKKYRKDAKQYQPVYTCAEFENKDAAVDFLNTMETWADMNQAKVKYDYNIGRWTVQMPKFTPIYDSKEAWK